jgi:hypothetical protein
MSIDPITEAKRFISRLRELGILLRLERGEVQFYAPNDADQEHGSKIIGHQRAQLERWPELREAVVAALRSIPDDFDERTYPLTPRVSDASAERLQMMLSAQDRDKVGRGEWEEVLTDLQSGRRYKVRGAACSLPGCMCDAVIVCEVVH